jgi:hypothetical protein
MGVNGDSSVSSFGGSRRMGIPLFPRLVVAGEWGFLCFLVSSLYKVVGAGERDRSGVAVAGCELVWVALFGGKSWHRYGHPATAAVAGASSVSPLVMCSRSRNSVCHRKGEKEGEMVHFRFLSDTATAAVALKQLHFHFVVVGLRCISTCAWFIFSKYNTFGNARSHHKLRSISARTSYFYEYLRETESKNWFIRF